MADDKTPPRRQEPYEGASTWSIVAMAVCSGVNNGYAFTSINALLPRFTSLLNLTPSQQGVLGTILFFGAIAGAVLGAMLNDAKGSARSRDVTSLTATTTHSLARVGDALHARQQPRVVVPMSRAHGTHARRRFATMVVRARSCSARWAS